MAIFAYQTRLLGLIMVRDELLDMLRITYSSFKEHYFIHFECCTFSVNPNPPRIINFFANFENISRIWYLNCENKHSKTKQKLANTQK